MSARESQKNTANIISNSLLPIEKIDVGAAVNINSKSSFEIKLNVIVKIELNFSIR